MLEQKRITEIFKNFNSHTDDYLGAMFIGIFNELPMCYRVYYDNDKNLRYQRSSEAFEQIKQHMLYHIDERKFLRNAINNLDPLTQFIFCYSGNEYLVLGEIADEKKANLKYNYLINITLGEISDTNDIYIEVYTNNIDLVFDKIKGLFEIYEKKNDVEFGIAAIDATNCVYTSWYDYKPFEIDIEKNYNDDFKVPYEKLCNIIETEGKADLVLLYGDPGTGKSSIIKHLITKYNDKDFIFMDGALLANASQEKLMSYFLDNQDTIFILEDCEKALMTREHYNNPVMPVLLNLTDGIISDVLGIKLICTFNTSLENIDKALKRKGRLSMKYEFRKLAKEKCQAIVDGSDKFEEKFTVTQDMTLAELYNVDEENDYSKKNTKKIGF